jgi:hypothetical protein
VTGKVPVPADNRAITDNDWAHYGHTGRYGSPAFTWFKLSDEKPDLKYSFSGNLRESCF